MDTRVASGRTFHHVFLGVFALLFAATAALTIVRCASMSAMPGMQMPGGWTMSMVWMRMPGQTWPEAAASFIGMWAVMMTAMMLHSLVPMLWRYRQPVGRARALRAARLVALVALGYFFVWSLFGLAVFPFGVATAALEMHRPMLARLAPIAAGLVVLIAGALQFTPWKSHRLTCCREVPGLEPTLPPDGASAWRQGLQCGFHCSLCCANLTAVLLVLGVMNLPAMVAVTVAITAERLAPAGERVAQVIGFIVVGTGVMLIARAVEFR